MNQVYLFDKNSDKINLAIPFVFLPLAILELMNQLKFTTFETNFINFATKIILFNHIHVFFTLCLAFWHPDIKILMQQKASLNLKKIVSIFSMLFIVFLLVNINFQNNNENNLILKVLILFISFVGLHHNYTQSLGLSLIYNSKNNLNMIDYNKKIEKIERYSIYLLLVSQFLYMTLDLIGFKSSPWTYFTLWITLLLSLTAFLTVFLYKGENQKQKRLFAARYLLYPMIPFSFLALTGVLAIHGIEYLYLFKKIIYRSSKKISHQSIQLMILSILLFTTLTITDKKILGWYFVFENKTLMSLLLLIGTVSTSISYLHYYIDSQLFKMSDPETNKIMNRLIN